MMTTIGKLLLIIGVLHSFVAIPEVIADAPTIEVSGGKIKGEDKESRDDRDFYAYRGIPYAKANRFEHPTKPDNWSDVRDAEEYGKKCIQYSTYEKKVTGSEDCLFINVFTPKIGDGISKKLLPVMVFIHGGFMDGTSEIYRAHYFMDQDIVIATFNYRLNVFGFLSTGDDVIKGNMGLKDQVMALQWIQENVRKFGGDPNRVTIFGAGDGASSVQLLMLSPSAKGLFRKAISQSGSALKLSVLQKRPKDAAQRLARILHCEKVLNKTENATKVDDCFYEDSKVIAECLKLVDAKKIAEAQKDAFGLAPDPLTFFGPVVEVPSANLKEVNFLSEHPYSIITSGRQLAIPWITGINAQEGLVKTGVILNDKSLVDKLDGSWLTLSPRLLKYDWSRTDLTKRIRKFYLSEQNYEFVDNPPSNANNVTSAPQTHQLTPQQSLQNPAASILPSVLPAGTPGYQEQEPSINFEEQFKGFTDLFTDRFYAFPWYESIRFQSKVSPVYVYYNGYEGQFSLLDVYTGKTKEPAPALKKVSNWFKKKILGRPEQVPKHMGVCNGDELPLLFKYPDLKIKENTRDYQMSKDLVKLWVQFATDESKLTFQSASWKPAVVNDKGSFQLLKFSNTPTETGMIDLPEIVLNRMKFWASLAKEYLAPFDQI